MRPVRKTAQSRNQLGDDGKARCGPETECLASDGGEIDKNIRRASVVVEVGQEPRCLPNVTVELFAEKLSQHLFLAADNCQGVECENNNRKGEEE